MAKAARKRTPKARLAVTSLTTGAPEIGVPTLAHGLAAKDLTTSPPIFAPRQVHHLEPGGDAPARPKKLAGKEWVKAAYDRKRERFIRDDTSITEAARDLAKESETAADCKKPMVWGYVKSLLRKGVWHTPPKERAKPGPRLARK